MEGRFGGQWSQDRVCGVRAAGTGHRADSTALDEQYGRAVRSSISNPVEGALLNSVVKKDIVPSMSEGVTGIKEAYACLFVCVSANFF